MMAAQAKAILDQVIIALSLKITKIHQLLSPEDGNPVDPNIVGNRVARMEEDFAEFKIQNANYRVEVGINDEGPVDTLYRNCCESRENIIDLYHNSMVQGDPAEVVLTITTNDIYDRVYREVLVLQGDIDE